MKFEPYLGKNYGSTQLNLLILGESHYCKKECCCFYSDNQDKCKGKTIEVVNNYLNYKGGRQKHQHWMNTFTKFSNVLNGHKQTKRDTIKFWEEVAFYNYVQFPTRKPKQSPRTEQFLNSFSCLEIVLGRIKPDCIILWGYRLSDNFPRSLEKDSRGHNMFYATDLSAYPVLVVPHPSSSKFGYLQKGRFTLFFESVKRLKQSK